MTDQNNLARAYSSDVSNEDPLAELARIVSGQEAAARRQATSGFDRQYQRTASPAAPAKVEAPSFDLEDALMAELGFEEAGTTASPPPAPAVMQAAPRHAVVAEPERPAPAPSLEDQLLAELSFDDAPAVKSVQQPARTRQEDPQDAVDMAALENEMAMRAAVVADDPDDAFQFDEFAAIFEKPQPQPARAQPAPASEDFNLDAAFEEAIAAPEEPKPDVLDSLDFGSAFEAELREMEIAVPVAAPPARAATVQRREPASERVLEDQFAAAFAEELDLGVSRALEGRKPAPAAARSRPEPVVHQAYDDVPETWEQDYPLDPSDSEESHPARRLAMPAFRLTRGMKFGAAALAFAIVIGGGALAMSFMGGDSQVASGDPVVVKADSGPVKVKPENPGGVEIQNQNQDVYNKVAGASPDGGSQEKLLSSAEEPLEIARVAEETPPADVEAATPADAGVETSGLQAGGDTKADVRLTPMPDDVSAKPAGLAPRRVKTMLIKPDGTVVPAPAEETVASVEAAPSNVSALAESGATAAASAVDAAVKPAAQAAETVTAAVAEPVAASVASAEPAAAPAASGEWAVQLASQRSAEDAQSTFQNLKQKFPAVLDGKALAIQKAEVEGKGVFYRVRVPTQTKDEAVGLCEELKAAGGSCFITR